MTITRGHTLVLLHASLDATIATKRADVRATTALLRRQCGELRQLLRQVHR